MSYADLKGVPSVVQGVTPVEASQWNSYVKGNFDTLKAGHVVCTSSTRPSSLVAGDEGLMIFETDTDKFLVWDGSGWVDFYTLNGQPLGVVAKAAKTSNEAISTAPGTTDISGLSVTWTAIPTKLYLITVYLNFNQGLVDDHVRINLTDSSNVLKQFWKDYIHTSTSGACMLQLYESGLSGSITRKVRAQLFSGSITVVADPTYPAQILVQDVGLA